jgi:tRNA1Val (adenine37-N6)-methyltransferase
MTVMNREFQFKQFSLQQDRCAMKVGTDGVLLGAWSSLDHDPETILDIGAGTGLLSLMMAQRAPQSFIEAIEIDAEAYEQCTENFEDAPWADRLFCYHASLMEFVEYLSTDKAGVEEQYDLLICNPPFYDGSYKTQEKARNQARFQDAMPFEHLVYAAANLLSEKGQLAVILPYKSYRSFVELAASAALYPLRICQVKGTPHSEPKRVLLQLSFDRSEVVEQDLVIETKRHEYTKAYIELTKDFYLKM